MRIKLVQGDITKENVDAIVNAANCELAGGGGVDGAIHRAAGPALYEACQVIRRSRGRCPTGEAVITHGGDLLARYVIHTPGPRWHGGEYNERELLGNCYRNCLRLAEENGVKTIAFPSISTGIYGFPIDEAVGIVFDTVLAHEAQSIEEVVFVLFDSHDFSIYEKEYQLRDLE